MQKVACAVTIVNRPRSIPRTWVKVLFSAIPETMPGRAIGRMTRNEIVSRPKNRKRATASDARVPSSIASAVAAAATLRDASSALRAPSLSNAFPNHSRVRPGGGQSSRRDSLKA